MTKNKKNCPDCWSPKCTLEEEKKRREENRNKMIDREMDKIVSDLTGEWGKSDKRLSIKLNNKNKK